MGTLFINAYFEDNKYFLDIKTLISVYLYRLSDSPTLQLKIRALPLKSKTMLLEIDLGCVIHGIIYETTELSGLCIWPVILIDNYVVSGLCSVARQICKLSNKATVRKLLGFREACLVACAESSVWTKFCEIDIIQTIDSLLQHSFIQENSFTIPKDVVKYENYLSKPVRMHNIYKIARDHHKDKSLTNSTPREKLNVLHEFAEGPYITLSDHILYVGFQIFFKYCQNYVSLVKEKIPLVLSWFNRLQNLGLPELNLYFHFNHANIIDKVIIPGINKVSLYNADPTRVVSVKHTKQYKIVSALDLVSILKIDGTNSILPFGFQQLFDWKSVPLGANPMGGALPAKRADRKCEQLVNLAKATLEVVGTKKYRIVDFCSGSGHLGILVATLLPNCQVILVENKEMSLLRARETILKLKLSNVVVVQSNLDYFVGEFDLGMALHACGVATDLVLQMCFKNRADFVCCPCCYGGIKDCHQVSYPRSSKFKSVFSDDHSRYFNLAHAADQTHKEQNAKTKQGYFCMDVIDTDRKLFAESCGYKVHLGKLQPVTCTNKNNLLVGIYLMSPTSDLVGSTADWV